MVLGEESMSEEFYCQDCDKLLSKEKGELDHGCLDCHGSVPSEKLFWLRKELESLKAENAKLREALDWATSDSVTSDLSLGYVKAWDKLRDLRKEFSLDEKEKG